MDDHLVFSDSEDASMSNSSNPHTPKRRGSPLQPEYAKVVFNKASPVAPVNRNSNSMSQSLRLTTLDDLENRWEEIWNLASSSSHWYLSPGSIRPRRQRINQPQPRYLTANDTLIFQTECWYLRTTSSWELREILVKDRICERLLTEWMSHPEVPMAIFTEHFIQKFAGITQAELGVLSGVLERSTIGYFSKVSGENHTFVEGTITNIKIEEIDFETTPPTIFELYGIDELIAVVAQKTPYVIKEAQIAKESIYFHKKMIESIGRKESSCVVRMPRTSTNTFKMFEEWLNTDAISPTDTSSTSIDQLIELYIFSDIINSKTFQNRVMDEIQDILSRQSLDQTKKETAAHKLEPVRFSSDQIRKIFEHTKVGYNHHLRQFCAATVSYWILALDNAFINRRNHEPNYLESCMMIEGFGKEFAFYQSDIVNRELRLPRSPKSNTLKDNPGLRGMYKTVTNTWAGFDICFFHIHAEDTPCDSSVNFDRQA